MTLPVVAALMLVLAVSPSARSRDLQVEAVAAAGAELPELREAVARALVVGGARVVMRGPTTGACEYCTKVKVIEMVPGVFRIEIDDQDNAASTTLDLSSGTRLLDRARAIAIHTRLLIGRPSGSPNQADTQARPTHTGKARVASASSAPVPPSPETRDRPSASSPSVDLSAQSERAPVHPGREESKPPSRTAEVKRPAPAEAKVAEAAPAPPVQRKTEGAPTRAVLETVTTAPAASSATPRWPWIPMAVGVGAGLAAGVCALVARERYNELSDKTQSLESARSLKSSGESWQWASYLLAGAAAAGVAVGIAGFVLSPSGGHTATATVAPLPGGGMAMMAWGLP